MTMNPYKVLRIKKDATPEEIEKAFRIRVKESHPDRGGSPEKAQKVILAYEILSNPERRKLYDETGDIGSKQAKEDRSGMLSILSSVFHDLVISIVEQGVKVAEIDLAEAMRKTIRDEIAKIEHPLENCKKAELTIREALDRFTVDDDPENLIQQVLQRDLADLIQQKGALEEDKRNNDLALAYLKKTKFRHAKRNDRIGF